VIATDLPVLGAFVREYGVGEVVADLEPAKIASAVARALEPRRLEILRASVLELAENTSWESEARALSSVYGRALTR
jgi:hypothetical protein